MMSVNMKLDISGCKRITFRVCRLHWFSSSWNEIGNIDILVCEKPYCTWTLCIIQELTLDTNTSRNNGILSFLLRHWSSMLFQLFSCNGFKVLMMSSVEQTLVNTWYCTLRTKCFVTSLTMGFFHLKCCKF